MLRACDREKTRRTRSALSPNSIRRRRDRKSTRLNSSHVAISYAVFCLKKKKKDQNRTTKEERQTTPNPQTQLPSKSTSPPVRPVTHNLHSDTPPLYARPLRT